MAVSLVLPKQYSATATLVWNPKDADPVTGATMPAHSLPNHLNTQVDIISSHNVALKVVDRLGLAELPAYHEEFAEEGHGQARGIRDWLADKLLKKLEVKPSRESNVIQLTYVGKDPDSAAARANAFAESYIATTLELMTEPAKHYSTWFEGQVKVLRDQLETAQHRLSEYQQRAGIVALDESLDVETAKLAELARQLASVESQAVEARSREMSRVESAPDVLGHGLIQKLKSDLAGAEARLAHAEAKFGPRHPIYLQAASETQSLRQKLANELRTVTSGIATSSNIARRREADFSAAFAEQKARLLELNRQKDRIAVLSRDVENAQQAYNSAVQRFNQMRLESQATKTNIAILNPAIPPLKPSSPKLLLNIALSLFLGTLLAMGASLLVEASDRRIRSAEDLESGLEIPVLAVLPAAGHGAFRGSAAAGG
jgi:chain length determinant protein EpsF